jgi:hypothetical protein
LLFKYYNDLMLPEPAIDPDARALMDALLDRKNLVNAAIHAFRRGYPDASEPMIEAAVHNVVGDGIEACVDWMAAVESFLREPENGLSSSELFHLLYHLYNWQMIEAIMPLGAHRLQEHLCDIEDMLTKGNTNAAVDIVKMLRERLSGGDSNPLTA